MNFPFGGQTVFRQIIDKTTGFRGVRKTFWSFIITYIFPIIDLLVSVIMFYIISLINTLIVKDIKWKIRCTKRDCVIRTYYIAKKQWVCYDSRCVSIEKIFKNCIKFCPIGLLSCLLHECILKIDDILCVKVVI